MPDITRRELKRITSRLEFLYEKLDGQKKRKSEASSDEFTNIQMRISEECVNIRQMIKEKAALEKKRENFIEVTKLKGDIKYKFSNIDDLFRQLRTLNQKKAHMKITESQRSQRDSVIEKLEVIVNNLKFTFDPATAPTAAIAPTSDNRIALKDLKALGTQVPRAADHDGGSAHPDDDTVLNRWRQKDHALDEKLDDVNTLLDQLKEQTKNISEQIDLRDNLVAEANKEADKVNHIIEEESHKLAKVLKSYRSPDKLALDICLIVLLVGLVSVIVMLAKNGK